jgi:tetratricopeptide (TPR) repeat protein
MVGVDRGDNLRDAERILSLSGLAPILQVATPSTLSHAKQIAELKRIVRTHPGQPLRWTELARHYLCVAANEKALKAMSIALALAPTNVLVVRSAVRMFIQMDRFDDAVRALKLSRRVTSNPWLLAAEVATHSQQQKTSRYMKQAAAMLEDRSIPPIQAAELAAAVGTVEHDNGRHKRAKQLFGQALVDPTENALAQALFVSRSDTQIRVPDKALAATPDSYEANARAAHHAGDWEGVQEQARDWLTDEPFDMRPALLGSFVSFAPGRSSEAVNIATDGLMAHPHDALLLNNRAVAYAFNGDVAEAWKDLIRARGLGHEYAYLTATVGLLAFRSGFPGHGAIAYHQATNRYIEAKDPESAVRAQLYWLREELRIGTSGCDKVLAAVRRNIAKLGSRSRESEIDGLIALAEKELEAGQSWCPTPTSAEEESVDLLFNHYNLEPPGSSEVPRLTAYLLERA